MAGRKYGKHYEKRLDKFRRKVYARVAARDQTLTELSRRMGVTPQKLYFILNGYMKRWEEHREAVSDALKTM